MELDLAQLRGIQHLSRVIRQKLEKGLADGPC